MSSGFSVPAGCAAAPPAGFAGFSGFAGVGLVALFGFVAGRSIGPFISSGFKDAGA
jgi:hypothetical protein